MLKRKYTSSCVAWPNQHTCHYFNMFIFKPWFGFYLLFIDNIPTFLPHILPFSSLSYVIQIIAQYVCICHCFFFLPEYRKDVWIDRSSVMLLSWNCQWTRWRGLMSLSTWSEKLTSTIKVRGPAQHNKNRKGKNPMIYLTQQWKCLCALKIMHAPYLGQLNLQRNFWSQIIR